jgi:hypothetical protein
MVIQAIGYPEVFRSKGEVISANLIKSILSQGHIGGLAFYEHPALAITVDNEYVEALPQSEYFQFTFHQYAVGWEMLKPEQVPNTMLADPFLRSSRYLLFPNRIEQVWPLLDTFEGNGKCGKI